MTPQALMAFHKWLFSCLPASASVIMQECRTCHKAGIGEGLPADEVQLTMALRELQCRGLVAHNGQEWTWRAEKVKEERRLFA